MATAEAPVILAVWAYLGKRLPYRVQAGNKKVDKQVDTAVYTHLACFATLSSFWGGSANHKPRSGAG